MLKFTRIRSLAERQAHLKRFIHGHSEGSPTLVVSDLRSKLETQNELLKKRGYILDFEILRASELWEILVRRHFPEVRMVSQGFCESIIDSHLAELDSKLPANSTSTVRRFIDQFAPVLFDPQAQKQTLECLRRQQTGRPTWENWFSLAHQFVQHFLDEKLLSRKWIASFLRAQWQVEPSEFLWQKPLIFDLGRDLRQTESDLIQILARHLEVEVLIPDPPFLSDFSNVLDAYLPFAMPAEKVSGPPFEPSGIKYNAPSPLAEAHAAVRLARAAADRGVDLDRIAIVAPVIEEYWPFLQTLLSAEGLPVKKKVSSRLATFPKIQLWLQEMSVRGAKASPGGLELVHYFSEQNLLPALPQRFEKLRARIRNTLDVADVPGWKNSASQDSGRLSRHAFAEIVFSTLAPEFRDIVARRFFANSSDYEMSFKQWMDFADTVIQEEEIEILPAAASGINVINLAEADDVPLTERIFLGLSQVGLTPPGFDLVKAAEIATINRQLGYFLADPEVSGSTYDLKWLTNAAGFFDHFFYPLCDSSGAVCAPSQFWLGLPFGASSLPDTNRWQLLTLQEKNFSEPQAVLTPFLSGTISASSIKDFNNCPYIFYAKRILGLLDPADSDLATSNMDRGSLVHKVLEKIFSPPKTLKWTHDEISQLLEEQYTFHKGPLWESDKEKMINTILRFQDAEKVWLQEHPNIRPRDFERKFQFPFENLEIKGTIDRVDTHIVNGETSSLIIDYKSSPSQTDGFKNWLKKNNFQLGLYTFALEQEKEHVTGAYFHTLKDMARGSGFIVDPNMEDDFERTALLSEENKDKFMTELREELHKTVTALGHGDFTPRPREEKLCTNCTWRTQCRAPHLL